MVLLRGMPFLIVAACAALRTPLMRFGDGSVTRRQAILLPAAAAAAASSFDRAIAADDITASIEKIVPMATLTAQLSAAAPRNIIITGANSGVGFAGAKILTAAGHRVTLACRTQAKADAAAAACMEWSGNHASRSGGIAKGAECDLASLESIRRFAESCKGSPLDSLVLNAGLARGTAETDVKRTAEGFEETIGVNHLGHFYLASLLLPTRAARAVRSRAAAGRGRSRCWIRLLVVVWTLESAWRRDREVITRQTGRSSGPAPARCGRRPWRCRSDAGRVAAAASDRGRATSPATTGYRPVTGDSHRHIA